MRLLSFATLFLLFGALVVACAPLGEHGGGGDADDDDSAQTDDDDATDEDDAAPGLIPCSGSTLETLTEVEPNDRQGAPQAIGPMVSSLCIQGNTVCGDDTAYGDQDWFAVSVSVPGPVSFTLEWDRTADMDFALLGPDIEPVLELYTESTTPPESGSFTLSEVGDYSFFVGCWTGDASAWALEVTAEL